MKAFIVFEDNGWDYEDRENNVVAVFQNLKACISYAVEQPEYLGEGTSHQIGKKRFTVLLMDGTKILNSFRWVEGTFEEKTWT